MEIMDKKIGVVFRNQVWWQVLVINEDDDGRKNLRWERNYKEKIMGVAKRILIILNIYVFTPKAKKFPLNESLKLLFIVSLNRGYQSSEGVEVIRS